MSLFNTYGDERTPLIKAMVEDYHAFASPVRPFAARANEALAEAWDVECGAEVFGLCAEDLREFLERMRGPAPALPAGVFRLVRSAPAEGGARVVAWGTGAELHAATLGEMWKAVVWVERQMAWRHAPVLPLGEVVLRPAYDLRITTSIFAQGLEDPADPLAYSDAYLRAMVHAGYNAFFIYVDLWPFCRSELLPEMSAAGAEEKRHALHALARRAERLGLKLVVMVNATRLAADHPLFARRPELKGSTAMRPGGHALCTSEPLTRAFYAEQMAALCQAAPGLGGLAFLIGGEGLLHCYTRPIPRTERVTGCPKCARHRPADVLAPLLNGIVAAVKDVSPGTRVMLWPYTSFIWQTTPVEEYDWSEDLALIEQLDPRATWLTEIEKDGKSQVPGVGPSRVWDYSIQYIGPSEKIVLHKAALRRRGMELAVKTETNISVELHSLPYLPVMERWTRRQRAIQSLGARVTWETWRFQGLWPSPSVEAAWWLDIHPEMSDDEALGRVAARLYGPAAAPLAREAWRLFSEAWEPSHPRYGTYWIGPMVMGPSHPYDLGGAFYFHDAYSPLFYQVFPGKRETDADKALENPWLAAPRFQLFPSRWPVERARDYGHMARFWARGMASLRLAFEQAPAELRVQAQEDVDMAEMVGLYIEEDLAFNEFTRLRDGLYHMSLSDAAYRTGLEAMAALLDKAIVRAESALGIVRRTPFVGWGFTYGVRVSAAMIEEKVQKTRGLLSMVKARLADGEALLA